MNFYDFFFPFSEISTFIWMHFVKRIGRLQKSFMVSLLDFTPIMLLKSCCDSWKTLTIILSRCVVLKWHTLCLKITQKSLLIFPFFFFPFFQICLFFNFVHFSIFLIFRLFDLFNFVHFCAFILSFFQFFNFIQFFHFCFLNETLLNDFQTLWNISSRKLPFSEFDHYSHIFSFSFFDRRP